MAESAVVTVRLEQAVADRLGELARSTRRSRSWLAAEAIAAYVETNAWQIAEIEAGLAELDAGLAIGEDEAERLFDQIERR
jgi:RHH-type transcriptional regulator, rel operon repressor / antitoxin RelB